MENRLLVKISKKNNNNHNNVDKSYTVKYESVENFVNQYIKALLQGEIVELKFEMTIVNGNSRKKLKEPILEVVPKDSRDSLIDLARNLPPTRFSPPRELEEIRRMRKTSVNELLKALGRKSRGTYYNIVRGKSPIDTCQLSAIAGVLDVTPDSIDVTNLKFLDI